MAARIQIFGADTIDDLPWPAHEHAQYAKKYLVPLIKHGARWYIDNVNGRMMALAVDALVMPLVVSAESLGDADVCSPYSHYVSYTLAEMGKRHDHLSHVLLRPLVCAASVFLRFSQLDKVVYVNNWLFTTNPCPSLTPSQVKEITAYLIARYPTHTIVFRSVNRYTHKHFFDVLRQNNYTMIASRKVYISNPASQPYVKNTNVRRDRNLLKKSGYEIIEASAFTDSDIHRMTRLYRDLYLKKHSYLNPQFNEKFFSLTLKEHIFTFKALKRNGQIDAFVSYYRNNGVMIGALLGYDLMLPRDLGLYRQAFAIFMTEASHQGQLINLSGGAGSFKVLRGAVPCIEYDAIYDHHLSYHRRLAWHCLWAGGILQ